MAQEKSSVINSIKLWIFPSIVTILATMIWRDVNELRADVKQLLADAASNKVKIESLEKQVQQLNEAVFKMPRTAGNFPQPTDKQQVNNRLYAILNKENYIVIKKFVPHKTN